MLGKLDQLNSLTIREGKDMNGKSGRGFASMSPVEQRAIARKGGKAGHIKGTAHEWCTAEAREAGRKGGMSVSRDRAHMAEIGRQGGTARGIAARAARAEVDLRNPH